jgi:hypothetical protein
MRRLIIVLTRQPPCLVSSEASETEQLELELKPECTAKEEDAASVSVNGFTGLFLLLLSMRRAGTVGSVRG